MFTLGLRLACALAALWLRDAVLLPVLMLFAVALHRAPAEISSRTASERRFVGYLREWLVLGLMLIALTVAGFSLPLYLSAWDLKTWCDQFMATLDLWPWSTAADRAFAALYRAGAYDRAFAVFFIFNTIALTTVFFLVARLPVLVDGLNLGLRLRRPADSRATAQRGIRKAIIVMAGVATMAFLFYVAYFHATAPTSGFFANYVAGGGAYKLSKGILLAWISPLLIFMLTGLSVLIARKLALLRQGA
jgi:hypothetical protein